MKKSYVLNVLAVLCLTFSSQSQILNEFEPNPPGADPSSVSIEILGSSGTEFSGYLISIENDGFDGKVDRFTEVSGTFDENGLLIVSIPDLENPSFTLVLTSLFTGSKSTDIDPDDNGILDLSSLGNIYDAIGIPDSESEVETMYGVKLGGKDFAYIGKNLRLAFREASSGDWYAINDTNSDETDKVYDLNGTLVVNADFDFNPAETTSFGSVNPKYNGTASLERNTAEKYSVFPNPVTSNELTITSKSIHLKEVSIFNILGKKVFSTEFKGISKRFDLADLCNGIYFLKVSENGKTVTQKLVIK
jgi:hypothetical protein